MPINKSLMDSLKKEYGTEKGTKVYYAMENKKRKKYSKGSKVAKGVISLLGKLDEKKAIEETKRLTERGRGLKEDMVKREMIANELMDTLEKDPRAFDELAERDPELAQDVMDMLPENMQRRGGNIPDESVDQIDPVEMARGADPEEVAQNLEVFFKDYEDIVAYIQTLDAGQSRRFIDNLSDEDYELFQEFETALPELGPREMKAEGGEMAVPPEMADMEVPVDTYANVSPEKAAAAQLPDEEMMQQYVDFIVDESLEDEEKEYLFNTLQEDPMLSQIFDKVVETASEFTGAGKVTGPGNGISDSIPARLSAGEFVFTKKATDQLGADNLQKIMDDAERAYDGGLMSGNPNRMEVMTSPAEDTQQQMLLSNRMPSIR